MSLIQWSRCLGLGFLLTSYAFAQPTPTYEQLQIPLCLAKKITCPHKVLAENATFKIIEIPTKEVDALAHLADQVACGRFINLSKQFTEAPLPPKQYAALTLKQSKSKKTILNENEIVYTIKHQDEVQNALKEVIPDNIWDSLTHLTSLHNRSATKKTGIDTAYWLKERVEAMALEYGRTDTTTYFVNTGWYKQPSVVTVIGTSLHEAGIVLGAHMDTLDGRMPGAGDDASGSANLLEVARILLKSPYHLKRPVYIIWYAAEERGLVGSQYVVDYFAEKNLPVKAAIQFDMTGYRVDPKDPTMWVYTDYTDNKLSNFVAQLIHTYLQVPVDFSECGYGCSDHASWTKAGVPAAFPCESNFQDHNPYIHTASDTMTLLNLEHLTNFTKLALAYAIELALD